MCEFKKTKENPPIALKNAVLKNSAYTTWDEAKKEWEFDKYYYNTTQRVCCPCSLREIKHIVAIKNIFLIMEAKIQYKNKRKSFSAMESSSFYYSFRVILTY